MSLHLEATDSELGERFHNLRDFGDLANLLEVRKSLLYYYAYKASGVDHYKIFKIPKKSGGTRTIAAPSSPLKVIQAKLNQILQSVYVPKATVHGFVRERSIVTNAKRHLEGSPKKRYVLNLDIADFFPSITQGRIAGLLMATPYDLPQPIASVIANLVCLDGRLPQGAPTSPILSNMICARMDTQLRRLAQKYRCVYTRYADDITFSTSLPKMPLSIATIDEAHGLLTIGSELLEIISHNGFLVNHEKLRLRSRRDRQEVTGLTINKFPNVSRGYVRQIRAMLHAWDKYGFDNANRKFAQQYYHGRRDPAPSLQYVIRGKLEFLRMVRGSENPIYSALRDKLSRLDPEYRPTAGEKISGESFAIDVATEGKSDWKHLKAALARFHAAGEFLGLSLDFWEYEDDPPMNDAELLKHCQYQSRLDMQKLRIYLFDRDNPPTIKAVTDHGLDYKRWNRLLYSMVLPVPSHRADAKDVCIEFYYRDENIMQKDQKGRRLFLSSEFDNVSCRHVSEDLNCIERNKVKRQLTIIDGGVFDRLNQNVALSKSDFALNILNCVPGFSDFDISEFRAVFRVMMSIAQQARVQ